MATDSNAKILYIVVVFCSSDLGGGEGRGEAERHGLLPGDVFDLMVHDQLREQSQLRKSGTPKMEPHRSEPKDKI